MLLTKTSMSVTLGLYISEKPDQHKGVKIGKLKISGNCKYYFLLSLHLQISYYSVFASLPKIAKMIKFFSF